MKLLSLRSLVNSVDSGARPDPSASPTNSSSRPSSTALTAQSSYPSIQLRRQRSSTARAALLRSGRPTPIEVEGALFDAPLISSPQVGDSRALSDAFASSSLGPTSLPPETSMPVGPTRFDYGEEPYSFNSTPSLKIKPWTRLLNSSRRSFRKRDSSTSAHGPPPSPSAAPRPSLSTVKAASDTATVIDAASSPKGVAVGSAPSSPTASLDKDLSRAPVDGFPPRATQVPVTTTLATVDEQTTTTTTSAALNPPASPSTRRARREAVIDGSPSASGGSARAVGRGSGSSQLDGSALDGSAADGSALDGSGLGSSSSGRRLDGSASGLDGSASGLDGSGLGPSTADESAADGSALEGPAFDGSALDGSALESSGSRRRLDGSASGLDGTADGSANEVGHSGDAERSDADDSEADSQDWRRRPAPPGRTLVPQTSAQQQARAALLDSEGSASGSGGAGERGSWPPTGLHSRFSDRTTTGTTSSGSGGRSIGGLAQGIPAPVPVPVSVDGAKLFPLVLLGDMAASSVSFDLGRMSRAKAYELRNAGRRASTG
ncbi:hypothetical protein JCM9279_000104 [Rhodotorula babjevae]